MALGCASVGLFATVLGTVQSWGRPVLGGAVAAGVYSIYAVHFTPIHWISSDDSLFIVLWTALALAAWTASPASSPRVRALLCGSLPVLQALALFSKESGAVLPLLMLCVSAFVWDRCRPGRPEVTAWLICSALILVWLLLRDRFTTSPVPEYTLLLDVNVLRNAVSLGAWLLNVPGEALRMMVAGSERRGVLWALAAAIPAIAFIYIAGKPAIKHFPLRQACVTGLFVLIGYAPYFPLAWQSYEYYAQVPMILPAVLLARGLMVSNRAQIAVLLLALSSFIAIEGSRTVEYPGIIGRARWAANKLEDVSAQEISVPLFVRVTDPHRFSAIGVHGLMWHLGLAASDIVMGEQCPETGRLLEQRKQHFGWIECEPGSND